ncbi:hypothetical protein K450DRAFT_279733 [Umbelopsis ramanniana AG]|uniref:BZIP domain-containing protein n=1 Tax=Umbelopsis ramanniana AG TaxID=1314678 RepID=A0AAD5EC75_UMBRA|nr:uncharacterized protein K450DRAFT_279733 [Umbelopsis ramanniana AG]KAI8580794.1 hypothetical protein K450DRAFT_279733 [Umbelopsis ramanniana AG]
MSQTYPFESFISSLNVEVPETNDLSEQELADELAIFANAQFTFDMPPGMGIQDDKPMPPEQHHRYSYQHQHELVLGHVAKLKQDQQQNGGSKSQELHPIVDHQGYQPNEFSMPQTLNSNGPYLPVGASMSTMLTSAQHAEHANVYKQQLTVNTNHDSATSSPANSAPNTPISEHPSKDDQRGIVGDDDKRRRNTAASARFRIKKKQREQALERTAKEMTEKSDRLESRVKELELEIKWLRSLLLEKDSRQSETTDSDAKKDH